MTINVNIVYILVMFMYLIYSFYRILLPPVIQDRAVITAGCGGCGQVLSPGVVSKTAASPANSSSTILDYWCFSSGMVI